LVSSAMAELGIIPADADRFPVSCRSADFESADLIIALSDAEHRPLMLERYAEWHARTDFWEVEDRAHALVCSTSRHSGSYKSLIEELRTMETV
jgi:hypothetical protein